MNGLESWKGILDKVKGRLRRWEMASISMNGQNYFD